MSFLIVKIEGGLGNQLLQYLFGWSLSLNHRKNVYFDISDYVAGRANRRLALLELNLPGSFIECHKTPTTKNDQIHLTKIKLLNTTVGNVIPTELRLPLIHEIEVGYSAGLEDFDNGYFAGYWQTYQYWKSPNDLLCWFNNLLDQIEQKKYSVLDYASGENCALHLRRGDYLNAEYINWHGVCGDAYYLKAINIFDCDEKIFFTDDIDHVDFTYDKISNYKNGSKLLNSEIIEFLQLRKFQKIAISNSSYSYLAALLATARYGINTQVIAPFPWYSWSGMGPDYPDSWRVLNRNSGNSVDADRTMADSCMVSVVANVGDYGEEDWITLQKSLTLDLDVIESVMLLGSPVSVFQLKSEQLAKSLPGVRVQFLESGLDGYKLQTILNSSSSKYLVIFRLGDQWKDNWISENINCANRLAANLLCIIPTKMRLSENKNTRLHKKISINSSESLLVNIFTQILSQQSRILIERTHLIECIKSRPQLHWYEEYLFEIIVRCELLAIQYANLLFETEAQLGRGARLIPDGLSKTLLSKLLSDDRININLQIKLLNNLSKYVTNKFSFRLNQRILKIKLKFIYLKSLTIFTRKINKCKNIISRILS